MNARSLGSVAAPLFTVPPPSSRGFRIPSRHITIRVSGTYFCSDKTVTAVVIKTCRDLADHKDSLGCKCRTFEISTGGRLIGIMMIRQLKLNRGFGIVHVSP